MGKGANYLKVIIEITNKASKTYSKYNEYKAGPEKFKEKEPNLYFTFQVADNLLKTAKDYITGTQKNILEKVPFDSIDKCYEILECTPKDNNEVIKSNYKRLVKEYHPDTISGKHLPKGFVEFANHRFKEIHGAYEFIKRERRF